jgi:hypothetical protein
MSFESLKDKLGRSTSSNQWEPVLAYKKKNLSDENIFVRYTQYETKTRGTINRMQINIGDKVAKLFDLHAGDRINIYFDRANVNLYLLKVDKEHGDYVLSNTKGVVLITTCVVPYPLTIPKNTTKPVFFDVETDDSILIDLGKRPNYN